MDEILLSELIARTKESIRPLEHSQSTLYQYQLGWDALSSFFIEQDQKLFSKQLANQFILEAKRQLTTGVIKKWRYKLFRRAALMLIACYEEGNFTWKYYKDDLSNRLNQSGYRLLQQAFLKWLKKNGKADRTIQTYEIVARQFLEYLEHKELGNICEIRLSDVSLFIPYISKQYQPTSMRTVLSALRSFLRYIESEHLSELSLSNAVPSSFGRKTEIIPTITAEEERKLLGSVDCSTLLGKRNNAILLLALRTGLRSTDIANLKMGDIDWKRNTIELVQEKTNTPLVLPLLTDVGNAIADYILNGRPDSPLPYIFLRTLAPYRKLSGRVACYGISVKMMKEAGIRQGDRDRKGFHCLRHSLAARLLAEETPLPVISSILGHRDKDSTKVYLSTDLAHLRACALSLAGIEVTKEELQ
jgi:integrase